MYRVLLLKSLIVKFPLYNLKIRKEQDQYNDGTTTCTVSQTTEQGI